jgi:hypothetical protein
MFSESFSMVDGCLLAKAFGVSAASGSEAARQPALPCLASSNSSHSLPAHAVVAQLPDKGG